ncbi:MerR family transcriptional regulator [Paenibacillus sp. sgz500958]|uniref:MerR family transcriptional regulator n=1 Tax=Paenibacillus sp. sgz500958 TaxID=3242475 RepID=UPI0036D2AEE4
MQIGEFIKATNTTMDTVRYYMDLSLLCPELKSNRYFFTEREVMDFGVIIQLKQWGFAVKEIQGLFEYKRQSGCGTEELLSYVHRLLINRVQSIEENLEVLRKQKEDVLRSLHEVNSLLTGLPLHE